MFDITALIVSWFLGMALTASVVLRDMQRLGEPQRARAWNGASFATAVFFFAPFCLIAHFWVTRRTLRAVLAGMSWLLAVLASQVVTHVILAALWPE